MILEFEIKGAEKVSKALKKAYNLIEKNLEPMIKDMAEETVKKSKQNINAQKFDTSFASNREELAEATKKARAKGIYWGKLRRIDRFPNTALKHTGRLYDSIKYNKSEEAVEMIRYGYNHHKGFQQSSGFGGRSGQFIKRGFIEPMTTEKSKEIVKKRVLKPIKRMFGQK